MNPKDIVNKIPKRFYKYIAASTVVVLSGIVLSLANSDTPMFWQCRNMTQGYAGRGNGNAYVAYRDCKLTRGEDYIPSGNIRFYNFTGDLSGMRRHRIVPRSLGEGFSRSYNGNGFRLPMGSGEYISVPHGLSRTWHSDGTLSTEENFKNGRRHGLQRRWRQDGLLVYEGRFRDDIRVGTFREWSTPTNGQRYLEFECTYENGLPRGNCSVQFRANISTGNEQIQKVECSIDSRACHQMSKI